MDSVVPRAAPMSRVLVGAVLAMGLLVVTSLAASRAVGTPFPSLLVDPFGGFSIVLLPSWQSAEMDIAIGAPVEAVGGDSDPYALPAERLAQSAARAASRGERVLPVRIGGPSAAPVSMALRTIGGAEILWFYALYVLAGLLLLWSGVAVAFVAWHRPGGRAYLALTVVGFVFLVTFLDYQTTRWLAPLFAATTLGNSVALFALAWWFPKPPAVRPTTQRLASAALIVGVVLSIVLAVAMASHADLRPLRDLANVLVPLGLLALVARVAWRSLGRGEDGADRAELRSAAWGLFFVPVVFGATFLLLWMVGQISAFHMALPFVSVAFPAAIGNALIRQNALSVRAVVTRRLMTVPIALIALAMAVGCAAPFGGPGRWGESILVGSMVATTVSVLAWLAVGRFLAAAEASFHPTLEGLADEVAALRTPDAIRSRLGELIHRCLPSRQVRTAAPRETEALALSAPDRARFAAGETVWTEPAEGRSSALVAPLRFAGEELGAVLVAPRAGDPLFTDGEVRVIQTIVSLGALALHHAELLREVEERRAIELGATRQDKRLAVGLVAAEIAHELSYPITFLRHFLKQVAAGRASNDVLEVGHDELDRLERMLAWVHKLQVPTPVIGQVRVRLVVTHVLVLLESDLESKGVRCEVDVPDDLRVAAEHDALLQLMANLLRNAAQAARGRIGVSASRDEMGETELRIWDDGPGMPPELASRIFEPLFTTNPEKEGHGLGLAVAERVARSFNWSIEVRREEDLTVFVVRAKRPKERRLKSPRRAAS